MRRFAGPKKSGRNNEVVVLTRWSYGGVPLYFYLQLFLFHTYRLLLRNVPSQSSVLTLLVSVCGNILMLLLFNITAPGRSPSNLKLKSTTPYTCVVRWDPVPQEYHYGILRGYALNYTDVQFSPHLTQTLVLFCVHRTRMNISDLLPYRKYRITVAMFNSVGRGNFSPPMICVTGQTGKFATLGGPTCLLIVCIQLTIIIYRMK